MSHYTVLVVGDDIDKQLAPFIEQVEDDSPYAVFEDKTEEVTTKFETDTVARLKAPDGSLALTHGDPVELFWREVSEEDYIQADGYRQMKGGVYYVPHADVKTVQIPFKEVYASLDEFVEEYYGYSKIDGKFGYYHNPNAKWDWYSIGGRWSGELLLKPGKSGDMGQRSWANEGEVIEENRCDSALMGDIDWERMREKAAQEATTFLDAMGKIGTWTPWETYIAKIMAEEMTAEDARKEYHAQPDLVAVRDQLKKVRDEISAMFFDVDELLRPREEYIEMRRNQAVTQFAMLKDGVWSERGQMGWFGCAANEKDALDWASAFWAELQKLPDDARVTVVDCHI